MANYYVYSGAAGAGTGANWANAYTTLTAAVSGKAAGDVFYIADDHAESTAGNVTITSPGTAASPCRILCVNRSGTVPPLSADLMTGASVSATTSGELNLRGESYWHGIAFAADNFLNVGGGGGFSLNSFKNCAFRIANVLGYELVLHPGIVKWDNTTFEVTHANSLISRYGARFEWSNTANAIVGATVPIVLIGMSNVSEPALLEGVDLSALGSGKTLATSGQRPNYMSFKDCKVGASVTFASGAFIAGERMDFIRVDSGATNYRTERYQWEGTLTTETTIVRTGGASDGTTPIAWKIVTTANSEWIAPFECFPIAIWNEDTGSPITVTVEGVWGGGAVPLNDEIWMDVEYLGSAATPQGSFATTNKADILATGANTTASTETWGGSTTAFKLVASVTPQMKGPMTATVYVAKPSSTFYIDPKITLS
jgi:hypothetical protein